ncbi:heterokaryon incompatibility protein-domain-containing protein [Aspergillus floccosus]
MGSKTTFQGTLPYRLKKDDRSRSIPQDSAPLTNLCSSCDKLGLAMLISQETKEIPIGLLSNYNNPNCPFCSLISQSIRRAWGTERNIEHMCATSPAPVRLYIRSRSPFSLRKNGRIQHPYPRLLLAIDLHPPSFQRNRASIKEVDRVRNRYIIAEVETLPDPASDQSLGGTLLPRREVGRHIDVELVRRWLDECKMHKHSRASATHTAHLFQKECQFRLIDVVDECLVLKSEVCEYVALSYVWGPIPTILSLRDDDSGTVPKSLSQSQQPTDGYWRIPRTVRDAMKLTRLIGMRYLWVDTLCIIQDDADDKARLVGRMDDVYDNAMVTVIAAAGRDADAGLCGISPRTGHPVQPEKIIFSNGASINLSLCLPSLCDEARSSNWNTRGWTFQEQCLSKRVLYFTAEEVYFNCSEKEGRPRDVQVRTGPPMWNSKLRKDPDPTPYHYLGDVSGRDEAQRYQTAVQDYTRKQLTFQQDVFNSFEGIFNRFKRLGPGSDLSIRHTQGISTQFLYQGILWFPSHGAKKRSPGDTAEKFSSWTWASWTGPIEFVFAESLWLSRNISHAVIKHSPLYPVIVHWYYGKTDEILHTTFRDLTTAKSYLSTRTGIDVDNLLDFSQTVTEVTSGLSSGDLGFFGPYVASTEFHVTDATTTTGNVHYLKIGDHHGEFRFDCEDNNIDELVPIVAGDTITRPPDTYSILLGLATKEGVSRRIGIGFIYYCKDFRAAKPRNFSKTHITWSRSIHRTRRDKRPRERSIPPKEHIRRPSRTYKIPRFLLLLYRSRAGTHCTPRLAALLHVLDVRFAVRQGAAIGDEKVRVIDETFRWRAAGHVEAAAAADEDEVRDFCPLHGEDDLPHDFEEGHCVMALAAECSSEVGGGYGVFSKALWMAGDAHYSVAPLDEFETEVGASKSRRAYDPDCLWSGRHSAEWVRLIIEKNWL